MYLKYLLTTTKDSPDLEVMAIWKVNVTNTVGYYLPLVKTRDVWYWYYMSLSKRKGYCILIYDLNFISNFSLKERSLTCRYSSQLFSKIVGIFFLEMYIISWSWTMCLLESSNFLYNHHRCFRTFSSDWNLIKLILRLCFLNVGNSNIWISVGLRKWYKCSCVCLKNWYIVYTYWKLR